MIQENEEMKAAELRQKDVAGMRSRGESPAKGPFRPAHAKATQQLNNTATLRSTRRDIARAKTILAEKQAAKPSKE
jgi:large subunit ribosomal protein L29